MVALSLLAVLAVLGYRALSTLLDAQQQVTAAAQRWGEIDRLFARIEADLRTAIPRAVRFAGATRPPLELLPGANGMTLAFSRAGPEFSLEPTSAGQRIAYRWSKGARDRGRLELLYWPGFDHAGNEALEAYVLSDALLDLRLRALGARGEWIEYWPPDNGDAIPRAIDIRAQLASGEWVERLLVLQ
jgi:general secretion pathway protein J